MGGKSGGSAKVDVAEYRMSVHMGICMGPATLTGIVLGDKLAWNGEVSTSQTIVINKPGLFGGQKKEGGAVGDVYFLHGALPSEDTSLPENLAKRLGLTSDTAPAFKGFASLFFVGDTDAATGGFLWHNNNPYLPDVHARARRIPSVFTAADGHISNYATIGTNQANPAHMIYECLTNTDWGMGASPNIIDTNSFRDCAKTFFDEGFGLSMMWTQQAMIESFITEILDHVQATLFVNVQTGLLTLKAVRGDYDPEDLILLTENNCEVTKFDRKVWGETINEINVSWTNPENEEEETVTLHDLANIEIQGGIVSDTRNYYGVRSVALAMSIAARDLRSAAAPLASFEIEADRNAWGLHPGGVFRLSYPEYGINGLVLRIGSIDYGRPGDSKIKISAIEDVFGLPQTAYTVPSGSGWQDESENPTDLEYFHIITLPMYFAARIAEQLTETIEYPTVFAGVLAATENRDTRSYELYGEVVDTVGGTSFETFGTKPVLGRAILDVALSAETQTVLSGGNLNIDFLTVGVPPLSAGFALIGNASDEVCEIVLLSSVAGNLSTFTLERGVLDTVPRAWPKGTPIWFLDSSVTWGDYTMYSDASTATYKATPTTSLGTLALADATEHDQLLTGRPYYPTRPGNVQVDGTGFGIHFRTDGGVGDFTVTWSRRNRLTEDSQVVLWGDGDITPEDGQTTKITVMDVDRNVLTTHTGLSGTSFSLPMASFGSENVGIVRVTAERDGFESLQGHEILVSFGTGYGTDYGNNYGDD